MDKKSNLRKFIYLTNFEVSSVLMKTLVAVGLLVIVQLIAFVAVITNEANEYLRFEELADMAGYSISFYIAGFVILGITGFCFYKNWLGSKSIYSLLCLPVRRAFVYFSKLTAAVISILILIVAQVANIFLSYGFYLFAVPNIPKVRNGLVLSFIRWDFLKLFYPSDLFGLLNTITYIIVAAASVLFLIILERSGHYRKALLLMIASVIIVLLPLPFGNWLNWSLVALQLGTGSLKLLNEGSIA